MNANFSKGVVHIVQELVDAIQKGKLAIFCGAGISIAPPSNLPSANTLRRAIVRKLINVDLDAETIMHLDGGVIKASGADNEYRKLRYPFEAFIQIVNENAPILDTLVEIYKRGEPNKNHTLIAELMKKGYVRELLTTNFDTKIEEALEKVENSGSERWKRGIDFKVFSNESEFLGIDFSRLDVPLILKVHGTIEDKESVRTTLETLSRKEMRESRARVLRHFFQDAEHDILILGSSISDEFDINPF